MINTNQDSLNLLYGTPAMKHNNSNTHYFSDNDQRFLNLLSAYKNDGKEQKLCIAHRKYNNTVAIFSHDIIQPSYVDLKTNSKQDTYITPAFYSKIEKTNKAENISSMYAFVTDIELLDHNEFMSDKLINDVVCYIQNWNFPFKPTFIVSSGRGIHFWYFLDKTILGSEQYQNLYNITIAKLNEKTSQLLSDTFGDIYKIDNITANKLIRLPGTYNSSAARYSKVVWFNDNPSDCHNFFEYANYFKEEKSKEQKQKKYSINIATNSPYSRRVNRIFNDFVSIAEYMDYNSITEGYRDNMLFSTALYYLISGLDENLIYSKLEYLNGCFPLPLKQCEINKKYKSAKTYFDDHHFNSFFTTQQIISFNGLDTLLKDSELDEQLRELCSKEQKAINKKARDLDTESKKKWNQTQKKKEKAKRAEAKSERNRQIYDLRAEGLTQSQIADKLSLTRQTVATVLKIAPTKPLRTFPAINKPTPTDKTSFKPIPDTLKTKATVVPDTIKKRYMDYLNGMYKPIDNEHYLNDLKIFQFYGLAPVNSPISPPNDKL